ncbi:MAG: methionyl-tRNA formyltransferase [Actinomycetota bacterium]|nr:methionyl-tRNA formyltransferase [Actinomycetota bacterium]
MTPPRRLVYLGSPAAAVRPLRALVEAGFEIALVVSQPDRRRGRGATRTPTPVKATALDLGLPVSERVDDVIGAGANLGVVVAYGRLIRPPVLAALDFVNLHFSLLPRWRGAAPVERAIFAGDHETGVCVMGLEEGLDTGPVYGCEHLAIGPHESADELRSRLVAAGSDLLVRTLTEGLGEPVAQEGEATYAAKLEASDLKLDWDRSAIELYRMVRVGGAWTTFRGRRLKVLQARLSEVEADQPTPGTIVGTTVAAGEGALELVEVQPEGKAAQPATAWRNGARPAPGDALGG